MDLFSIVPIAVLTAMLLQCNMSFKVKNPYYSI